MARLFFAKGYGYSDVRHYTPVDAERSLFRIGSTSKLFTWTAVMQLVEQGKLDLDTDVNNYLDFKIPATYPQPITLRHIMTHTPGFEEDGRDLITDDSTHIDPARRLAGDAHSRRVSAARHVLVVLELRHGARRLHRAARVGRAVRRLYRAAHPHTARHDTDDDASAVARAAPGRHVGGLRWAGGSYVPQKYEIVQPGRRPGSVASSATDMAKFMIAHLNNGEYNGQRILADSTAQRMHARAFGHDPRLPGFALGFYEKSSHGLRIIGHGGDTQWFHTDLALIPDEKLGVFVSYNTSTGGELSFGPFLTAVPRSLLSVATDGGRSAGRCREGSESRGRRVRVQSTLVHDLSEGDRPRRRHPHRRRRQRTPRYAFGGLGDSRLLPVGPLLYRDELGGDLVAFQADSDGHVMRGFLGETPMMTMERVPFSQSVYAPLVHSRPRRRRFHRCPVCRHWPIR